jgi:hypothetical protein
MDRSLVGSPLNLSEDEGRKSLVAAYCGAPASAPSEVAIKWNVTNLPQNRFSLVSRILLRGSSFPYTSNTIVLTTSIHRDVKLGM